MGPNNDAMVFIKIKNNKFLKEAGFTLVEMLVSIGIMIIIFTIAALNLNARKPEVLVENAAREFLSQLTFAKNLALTGAVFKDEDGDAQFDVPFGYGLHFFQDSGQNQHFIFGDLYGANPVGDKKYNGDEEKTNWGDFVVDDKVAVEIRADGVAIDETAYPLDIFFETFNGQIYYYDANGENGAVEIQTEFSYSDDSTINQTVIINKNTNQIYLEE